MARLFVVAALLLVVMTLTFLWRFWVPESTERELEEYAVYSKIIEADQAPGLRPTGDGTMLVIQSNPETLYQKAILFFFLRGFRSFKSDTGAAYSLMIASALTRHPRKELVPKFTLSQPYRLMAPNDRTGFFSPAGNDGAKVEIYAFSPIAFNRECTKALFYAERHCGLLCGEYQYLLVVKTNGKWTIKRRYFTGFS